MTQQELLRIYSMYLPYGLKGVLTQEKIEDFQEENWFDDEEIFKIGAEWELCGYAPEDLMIPIGEGYFNGFLWRSGTTYVNFHRGIYPSLRPLSDLTKEIEHEGERFVPIEKILEDYCFNLEKMDKKEIESYALSFIKIDMPLKVAEFLFKWHFDIEDLIGKGLAVNKNEIK